VKINLKTKNMCIRKWILLVISGCLFSSLYGQNTVSKVPYKLNNDFETGELFGWEPYPYEQDIGYDALYFARRTPTHNNSKYALARPVRAYYSIELYHGFTRRLNFYTNSDSHVKASVYFQSDRNPGSLEVSLGTFDGRRFMYTIQNPQANRWLELDIPASNFKLNGQSLKPGEHIQVITVKGSYPMVYYLNTYTILMDDVQINGDRDARFVATTPTSTNLEMFDISILNKHFFYGDNISLKATPENNLALREVKGTLVDSKGKVVKDNIPFTHSGNEWVNQNIYKLTENDARGQWEIRLKGLTDRGSETNWAFKFLMPGKKVNEHPRLFFSADELKERIANEKSPAAKSMLDRALQNTSFMNTNIDAINEPEDETVESLSGPPFSPSVVEPPMWRTSADALGRIIEAGSFRYAFTGDAAAGQKAKQALLKLCSFSKWNNNWMLDRKFWTYYPVGYIIKPVAFGYDMLYNLLTENERAQVRKAIMEKGLKLFYRDMVEMNRMPSQQTNHIAVIVTGFGLAATAIYGDDPTNPALEPYISGILAKTKAYIDYTYYEDGSYAEPKSGYMNMAARDIAELLPALERNFGVDYTTTTNFQNVYKFPIQASTSSGRMQDYGDGGGTNGSAIQLGSQLHYQWLAKRTGNPYIYNWVKPYWESGNGGYMGYLWYRNDITPATRETLPTSKVFSAQGIVMRSGWDDASTIIITKLGPNANHAHLDQGSFQVMTNGETLLTDPGPGGGHYYDFDYLAYNMQAIAHNVMLVDHDPESQTPADYDTGIAALRDWPRVYHSFASEIEDEMSGDLTTVYKGKLDKYTRTLLYTKSGPLFMFDQVKSKSPGGHEYDWLFHAGENNGQRSINYTNNRVTIDRPKARLTLDVVSPDILSGSITDKDDDEESFIRLSSKPNLQQANFLAVIMPEAKPATGDYSARPKTTAINEGGWIGAKVERQGAVDYGYFRTSGNGSGTIGGFTTDAKQFTASFDGSGKLLKAYFEGSSFAGNGLTLKSNVPVTCALATGASGTKLEVQSDRATTLAVSFGGQPSLTLQIPAGKSNFSVK
jgi:hypothetical protein